MNAEQRYIDLVEICLDFIKAYDQKLYEPQGSLNGHHYLAREEKQRKINLVINEMRYQIGLDFEL